MDQFKITGHDFEEIAPMPIQAPAPTASATPTKLDWFRTHPYSSVLAVGGALLIIGALFISTRSAVNPSGEGAAWGGVSINLLNPAYIGGAGAQDPGISVPMQTGVPYSYIPPAQGGGGTYTPTGEEFDFNAFISELSRDISLSAGASSSASSEEAFSFIPKGFISTTTPAKSRSKVQQELYEYGNEAGSYIESFEGSHRDQPQVLKNWLENRSDEGKRAAVIQLGRALWETGRSLLLLESVPKTAASLNRALAESYMEIGGNLALIPKTESDTDFLKAIGVYNASAEAFGRNYVALINLFGAYDVSFSADEPGSVFTFKPIGL